MKKIEEPKNTMTVNRLSVSSNGSSVNVDGLWNIVPHCSLKQAFLITCVAFSLMNRGVLVSRVTCFNCGYKVKLDMQVIYVSFAQIRPNHVCDQSKTNSNDVTYDACANAQEM